MLGRAGEWMTKEMRLRSFSNLLRLHVAYFDDDRHSTGSITTRFSTDAPNCRYVGLGTVYCKHTHPGVHSIAECHVVVLHHRRRHSDRVCIRLATVLVAHTDGATVGRQWVHRIPTAIWQANT